MSFQAVGGGASAGSVRLLGRGDDPGPLRAGWHGDVPANSDPQPLLQVLPDGAAEAQEAGHKLLNLLNLKFGFCVFQKLFTFCLTFLYQGVNVEEVRSDCLSAAEIYHQDTPSSVQIYQVPGALKLRRISVFKPAALTWRVSSRLCQKAGATTTWWAAP